MYRERLGKRKLAAESRGSRVLKPLAEYRLYGDRNVTGLQSTAGGCGEVKDRLGYLAGSRIAGYLNVESICHSDQPGARDDGGGLSNSGPLAGGRCRRNVYARGLKLGRYSDRPGNRSGLQ